MSDLIYRKEDYLFAHDVVMHLQRNLSLQFQVESETWDRERAEINMKDRCALLHTQTLLLDVGDKLNEAG